MVYLLRYLLCRPQQSYCSAFNNIFLFTSIFIQGKKFAKPELKSCIEEFEEKINKLHIEKKDQELTAKNAQAHKERIESLGNCEVAKKADDSGESEITEGKHLDLACNLFCYMCFSFAT